MLSANKIIINIKNKEWRGVLEKGPSINDFPQASPSFQLQPDTISHKQVLHFLHFLCRYLPNLQIIFMRSYSDALK